ncbi:hypothetical protein Pfo_001739 [Paulownia fortunei]|nr:hypothetical protein Pfo_001739 [Paulownia fortunei]
MGRGKIEIKQIENANSRQVTFSKRRAGLFKKARELAILCEAEVAVIIFSSTGKMFEFSSSDMKEILTRFNKCLESRQMPAVEYKPEQVPKEVNDLKQEMEKLNLKLLQLLGKDLTGMDLQELRALEQQLNEGLLGIKERKEQILMQQLAQSRMREELVLQENQTLRIQAYVTPLAIDYRPETTCNVGPADKDSDTILHLGPPSEVGRKRKTPDGENHSSNSHSQVRRR